MLTALDNDGDQDVYVTLGGAVEGDDAHNALFINENEQNNWIRIDLMGKENTNTLGARVRVTAVMPSGVKQYFFHTVGDGGTFGSNSLSLEIGLGKVKAVDEIRIQWPGRAQEIFKNVGINSFWVCKEGTSKPLKKSNKKLFLNGVKGKNTCCK